MPAHRVTVIAFDRISPFHLAAPCLIFGDLAPAGSYALEVCAAEPGPLRTTAGFTLGVAAGLEALAQADTVIVPSWRETGETPPPALIEALRTAAQRGVRLVGLCLGAYVLAEAGLLDGRRATTHWAWATDFAARFPQVTVDPDVLYVDEGVVVTAAGTAAALDCCLHLLRRDLGAEAANGVARRLVLPPHRQGGQAQFIEQPVVATARAGQFAALLDQVRGSLHRPHSLDSLAEAAAMSRRTFSRRFRQYTGSALGDWLLAERLAFAQRLLEGSDQPVERIAELAGFGSTASLRQQFGRAFGLSPRAYRQGFRGVASGQASAGGDAQQPRVR